MSLFGGGLARVNAHVEIGSVRAMLSRLGSVRVREVFRNLRGPARYDQGHHDRKEEGPGGHWPALAASTVARNRYRRSVQKSLAPGMYGPRHRKVTSKGWTRPYARKLLGRLPKGVISTYNTHALTIRARVRWAIVHQAGGRAGHGARIPRRQYLWISDWLGEQARQAFLKAMNKAGAGVL